VLFVFNPLVGILIALQYKKNSSNRGGMMSSMTSDSVLTSDEAIQYLRISKPTFLKYIRLGKIKAIKAGKGWRVLHSELYRFLKEGSSNDVSLTVGLNEDEHTDYPIKNLFD
jgi:excisionase family DNA binding protein